MVPCTWQMVIPHAPPNAIRNPAGNPRDNNTLYAQSVRSVSAIAANETFYFSWSAARARSIGLIERGGGGELSTLGSISVARDHR